MRLLPVGKAEGWYHTFVELRFIMDPRVKPEGDERGKGVGQNKSRRSCAVRTLRPTAVGEKNISLPLMERD